MFIDISLDEISGSMGLLFLGYMVNTDLPMTIAACCEDYFFIGCLDDVSSG